jgi:hypothetical protein
MSARGLACEGARKAQNRLIRLNLQGLLVELHWRIEMTCRAQPVRLDSMIRLFVSSTDCSAANNGCSGFLLGSENAFLVHLVWMMPTL